VRAFELGFVNQRINHALERRLLYPRCRCGRSSPGYWAAWQAARVEVAQKREIKRDKAEPLESQPITIETGIITIQKIVNQPFRRRMKAGFSWTWAHGDFVPGMRTLIAPPTPERLGRQARLDASIGHKRGHLRLESTCTSPLCGRAQPSASSVRPVTTRSAGKQTRAAATLQGPQ
jgi:hypothetical protein